MQNVGGTEANKRGGEGDTVSTHDTRSLRGKVLTLTKKDESTEGYQGVKNVPVGRKLKINK